MKKNRVLQTAVVAALSLGTVGNAYAAGVITFDTQTTCGTVPTGTSAKVLASELVSTTGANINLPSSGKFCAGYTFDTTIPSIQNDINVTFTLTGAEWNTAKAAADVTVQPPNATANNVTIVGDGQGDQSTVKYLVQVTAANELDTQNSSHKLLFSFDMDSVDGLSSSGGQVELEVQWQLASGGSTYTDEATILNSASGVNVVIADENQQSVEIDVAQESKVFTGSLVQPSNNLVTTLGKLFIGKPASTAYFMDMSTDYALNSTSPASGLVKGTFHIENGPFSASLAKDSNDKYTSVFIDVDGSEDCTYSSGDLTPDTLTESSASWDLSVAELATSTSPPAIYTSSVYNSSATGSDGWNICVIADGQTSINDHKESPAAALVLEYSTGKQESYADNLKYIKRNGTTCTLYNVPHPLALDQGYFRFTNKSKREGVLLGTLRNRDGVTLMDGIDLLDGTKIQPNQTVVVTASKIAELAVANGDAANFVDSDGTAGLDATTDQLWKGRAILAVSSDLTDMEAYDLIRGKAALSSLGVSGPIINVSGGATGNACE